MERTCVSWAFGTSPLLYNQTFKQITSEQDSRGLLVGKGILVAAKEERLKSVNGQNNDQPQPA